MLSRREMPLNGLRSFEAAARHLNMGQAAMELGVTQGAVSQQIKTLEAHLGTELFERRGRSLRLTAAGRRLLPVLRDSFDRIAQEATNLNPGHLEGELTVASTASALGNWLLSAVSDFWKVFPHIDLQFEIIEKFQDLLPANIDVAICYGEPTVPRDRLRQLVHYDFFPVCSPSYLNGLKHALSKPKDLANCSLLSDDHGEEWQRWSKSMDVDLSAVSRHLYLSSSLLAIQAARLGLGVVLADRLEVADDLAAGRLVRVFKGSKHRASQSYFIVTPPTQQLTARSTVFIEWLTKRFEET